MKKDFKKEFFAGVGGLLGVLSIPVLIYLIYFLIKSLYVPTTNLLLRKKEYVNWIDCLDRTKLKRSMQLDKEMQGYSSFEKSRAISEIVRVQKEYCGKKPNEWKWQLETYYKPSK